jgi:hypothetical protein
MYDENLEFDDHDEEFSQWLDDAADQERDAREEFTYRYQETAKMLAGGAYDVEVMA